MIACLESTNLGYLHGQSALGSGLGGPETSGEDVDVELQTLKGVLREALEMGLEAVRGLGRLLHVLEHTLELGGELKVR